MVTKRVSLARLDILVFRAENTKFIARTTRERYYGEGCEELCGGETGVKVCGKGRRGEGKREELDPWRRYNRGVCRGLQW